MNVENVLEYFRFILFPTCQTPRAMNHHVELFDSRSKRFNRTVVAHVQLFVSNARIGSILRGCEVGDDDVCAVIEKGFCECTANTTGTAGDQNVFSCYAEIRCCRHTTASRRSSKLASVLYAQSC